MGVYFRSSEFRWRKREKKTVIQRSTRRTGQGSFRLNGKLAGHGQSMITIREWFVSGALKTNKQDTTATPRPAQPLLNVRKRKADEDEVLVREKVDDDSTRELFQTMTSPRQRWQRKRCWRSWKKNCCETKTISKLPVYLVALFIFAAFQCWNKIQWSFTLNSYKKRDG